MTRKRDEKIKALLEQAPKLPGIYIMKGGEGEILYIGKAKVLANRVRSYFQNSAHMPPKTRILVPKIEDIRYLTTKTEQEALILESNFIKRHQPRYNVLLKDDKHYPYLRLKTQELFPRLEVVRRVLKDGATYFGPYTMVREVRETIRLIYKIFPLRQSADPLDGAPKRRPCLNFHMGRCLAPCAGEVEPEAYNAVVQEVIQFLKGKNTDLVDRLKEKMDLAARDLNYEEAATWRDKIEAVKTVLDKQKIISTTLINQDVIACHRDRGLAVVQMLIIRNGKMVAEKTFKMKNADEADAETIGSFLKQYYLEEPFLPGEILLSTEVEDAELIAEWLSGRRGGKVRLETPVRGQKRDLVRMAEENARFAVRAELDRGDVATRSLEELQETLGLRNFPRVIEGFDISNTMGQEAVGSMVRFEHARPEKKEYRRFKIKTVQGIDDYAMLSEVLTRRYMRLIDENAPLPDLILIDGGKGHLNTAYKVIEALDIEHRVDLACIAKGKFRHKVETDEVYLPGRKEAVGFKDHSPSRFLLQRVRDESHRFAIEYHRKLRGKKSLASPLETIPGVGKKRRLALLKHFGSLEAIKNAPAEEIAKAPGIPLAVARKIAATI